MTRAIARALLALAACCMGNQRRDWAIAMEGEFEAATEDGAPLRFATGCLVAAWREMPRHEEGRFLLANYLLVFGLMLPITGVMLTSIVMEFPGIQLGHLGLDGLPQVGSPPLLTDATRTAIPAFAILVLLLAVAQLRMAWTLLNRDWVRVANAGRMAAALIVTLALFAALVFFSSTGLVQAGVLGIELAAIVVLAHWHGQIALEDPATGAAE